MELILNTRTGWLQMQWAGSILGTYLLQGKSNSYSEMKCGKACSHQACCKCQAAAAPSGVWRLSG